MSTELTNIISIFLSAFATCCIIYSVYIQKAKINSQDKVNADLKTILEMLNVERLKNINDWEKEAQNRVIESRIDDFMKDQIPNLEKITKPKIEELSNSFKEFSVNATLELVPYAIGFINTLPEDEKLKFIEENFIYNKQVFKNIIIKQDNSLVEKK